jgi:glycosyltransferase involved in cell wall biosynthesis
MSRICMVAYTHYATDSRVRREAEALTERGDSVDFICLKGKSNKANTLFSGVRLIPISMGRYRGSNPVTYVFSYFAFLFAAFFRLTYLHLISPYQVIQVHTMPDFMVFTALIPKLLGARVILDIHDLMPELYQSKFGLPKTHWFIKFIIWMECISVRFADRAITVHKPLLNALEEHGNPPEKFIILINLPDPKIFNNHKASLSMSKSEFMLIYHGTVAKRHGLELAIQAIANLKDEISQIKLQIIGGGDDIPRLINLVKTLGLNDRIDIVDGFVPIEELVPVILEADVGIVPILYDSFTKYMLPVKLLEYIILHKPVICSRTETIEAYFDDSMIQFCIPGNAGDLTEQIRFLYKNPERREQLIINADRFSQEYNWLQQKQLYYHLIDELSTNHHKRKK